MKIEKEEFGLTPTISEKTLIWEGIETSVRYTLDDRFNCLVANRVIGYTQHPYEKIGDDVAEVKTYALGCRINKSAGMKDIVCIANLLIDKFVNTLGREHLGKANILIRRAPEIKLNDSGTLHISCRAGICPAHWTEEMYAEHRKFIDDVKKKLDTLKEV